MQPDLRPAEQELPAIFDLSAPGIAVLPDDVTEVPASIGLDILITKAVIDLQALQPGSADACLRHNLEMVRESASLDAVFIALFDSGHDYVDKVIAATGLFCTFNPEIFCGQSLAKLPYLRDRLARSRVIEMRDTTDVRQELQAEGERFSALAVRSVLLIGLVVEDRVVGFMAMCTTAPRDHWDTSLHLILQLIATSYATGLERLRTRDQLARLRERNELALEGANDGLWDFDPQSNSAYFSPRWKAMLGYSEDELNIAPDWRRLIHPEDLGRYQAALLDHLAGRTSLCESVHRVRHRNGEYRWVSSRVKARLDENGRALRLVGVELDITDRKLYEEALFREKESAYITLQSIGDGVIATDAECRVDYLNPVAEQLTGWRTEDASGRTVSEIFRGFHEETCEPLENPLGVAIRRQRSIKSVRPMLLIRRDGNELYIDSCASPIRDAAGKVCGGVLVFHDVSESRELNRKLSYHASHDMLTGLVNRRELEQRLDRALKSTKAGEASYALCHFDLDQFKLINDNCGHTAGDAVLGQVASLLKSKIRWRDTVARLGGDEFGILLESCSMEEALRMADSLREAVRNFKFVWEDRTFRVGASVGVVPLSREIEDAAALLSAADSACAAAKEAGRNRTYSFQENDIDLMRRRREMQWAARITTALEDGRFEIYRQTIEPLQKPELGLHYELLLRMRDEMGKIISPDQFIVAAERYGITPQIDRWMIENAFRWLVSEADERERLALCSINLSGQSLGDDKFLPFVIEQFHRSGLDGGKICFEITETAAIASFSQANRFIQALKELGCKFALDDFGTGLSSFGYLKHFPVDFLKIDGSFVREILHDPIDREMVRSINEIGHLTGKRMIAEFAENPEIVRMLRGMGVDYAQGYAISMPQRVMRAAQAERPIGL